MPSIRVLCVLLAVILLFMEVKMTSAASIVKDVDEDETLENEDGEAMENSWPWHGVEDTSDYSDLSDLANSQKRGTCIDLGSRLYCKLIRRRGMCRSRSHRARIAMMRCERSCGRCHL